MQSQHNMRDILELKLTEGRVNLRLRALFMGKDLCVLLDGGQKPHIGAIVTAYEQGIEQTCLMNHKEDDLARHIASALQNELSCTVTCLCGIHIPQITKEEIKLVYSVAYQLLEECIKILKS